MQKFPISFKLYLCQKLAEMAAVSEPRNDGKNLLFLKTQQNLSSKASLYFEA